MANRQTEKRRSQNAFFHMGDEKDASIFIIMMMHYARLAFFLPHSNTPVKKKKTVMHQHTRLPLHFIMLYVIIIILFRNVHVQKER